MAMNRVTRRPYLHPRDRPVLVAYGESGELALGSALVRPDTVVGWHRDWRRETCRLEPIDNPFGPKVLPMSSE
jgi:hypothetical protein